MSFEALSFNIYGETLPWTTGEKPVDTMMSMLNYTKYPPSLDFLLLTLGIAFLLMSWLDTRNNRATRAFGHYKRKTDKAWVKYF